jgi:2-haloalkanoic acid dehalogenase type II
VGDTPVALFFDAWGTLFDEGKYVTREVAMAEEFLKEEEGRITAAKLVEERLKRWAGLIKEEQRFNSVRSLATGALKELFSEYRIDGSPEEYLNQISKIPIGIYPEVREVLRELKGIPKGVLSNMAGEQLRRFLDETQLSSYFGPLITPEVAGAPKPTQRIFLEAVKITGHRADEIVHVGDSWDDILAKRAGLRVAWVNRKGMTPPLDLPRPDYELTDLRGLVELFK